MKRSLLCWKNCGVRALLVICAISKTSILTCIKVVKGFSDAGKQCLLEDTRRYIVNLEEQTILTDTAAYTELSLKVTWNIDWK
jgi:hypothetical protein